VPAAARAQASSLFVPYEMLPLWPGIPPGGPVSLPELEINEQSGDANLHDRMLVGIAEPAMLVNRPANPDGSALLVVPGGGYRRISIDNEGFNVAARLGQAGITAFVLVYRLPAEGWRNAPDVPLQDAQRAMRLIRTNAPRFDIDPSRLGTIGFSAGGHIAAQLATRGEARVYEPQDEIDHLAARPEFAAMLYPVITMLPPYAHESSREMLLGSNPSVALRAAYSCERLVTPAALPSFLAAALDDPDVPPDNTLAYFAGLRGVRVPVEMHLFEKGGHGFGIGAKSGPAWPDLFVRWGVARGYFRGA
jgi:acetyl esterase/lipase